MERFRVCLKRRISASFTSTSPSSSRRVGNPSPTRPARVTRSQTEEEIENEATNSIVLSNRPSKDKFSGVVVSKSWHSLSLRIREIQAIDFSDDESDNETEDGELENEITENNGNNSPPPFYASGEKVPEEPIGSPPPILNDFSSEARNLHPINLDAKAVQVLTAFHLGQHPDESEWGWFVAHEEEEIGYTDVRMQQSLDQ